MAINKIVSNFVCDVNSDTKLMTPIQENIISANIMDNDHEGLKSKADYDTDNESLVPKSRSPSLESFSSNCTRNESSLSTSESSSSSPLQGSLASAGITASFNLKLIEPSSCSLVEWERAIIFPWLVNYQFCELQLQNVEAMFF